MLGIVLVLLLQASPEAVIQGDEYQLLVPHGWSTDGRRSVTERLIHTSGASFEVRRVSRPAPDLKVYAVRGAEQVWRPLGFAVVGQPLERKVRGFPAIQYDIQGNRLSERRKLRYIVVDRGTESYELIYENSEEGFDLLLSEAERMGSAARPVDEANEEQALHTLRALNTAQTAFLAKNGRYGSLAELIGAGLADSRLRDVYFGYGFQITLSRTGYRVDARPVRAPRSSRTALYSERDGIVRSLDGRPWR